MNSSNDFIKDISEYYLKIINSLNQETYSFRQKKKNILNQSNILFTEIIINYCQDLRNKLDSLSCEFRSNPRTKNNNSKNIIESLAEVLFYQNDPSNKKALLGELESFYQILSELNSLLVSKFKFTFINIINDIIDKYKVNDSLIFINEQKHSIPCTVVKEAGSDNIYSVKSITDGAIIEKNRNELYPDIIDLFIKGKDDRGNIYSMIKYICRLLSTNEEAFEIKLYLLYSIMPVNLFQRKFVLDDSKYFTLNRPVFVWNDSSTFEHMKCLNIGKNTNILEFEKNYKSLYNENLTLPPHSEIEIIYEDIVLSFNYKLQYNINSLKNNMTRYAKIIDKKSSNIYWIQLIDIEFQIIKDTYFYSYDKRLKRNLLKNKDSIVIDDTVLHSNNNIILPDKETNRVLFLTPVTLYSEYHIPVGTKVSNKFTKITGKVLYFDEKKNEYLVESDDKYGSLGWRFGMGSLASVSLTALFIGTPIVAPAFAVATIGSLGWVTKKLTKKWGSKGYDNILRSFPREALIWDDYQSVEGYISLEDTNCHLLTENNLNGLLFKYLDKNILGNIFSLLSPIMLLQEDEKKELDSLEKQIGVNNETLKTIYQHSSNPNLSWYNYITSIMSENISLSNSYNLGVVFSIYQAPLSAIGIFGGRKLLTKAGEYFGLLKSNNIDLDLIHSLNVKKYFGQDLEKLIFQCLKYDYKFQNTPVLLEAIFGQKVNNNFEIKETGYEMLSFFLEFSRLNEENKTDTFILFKVLLSKIVSSEQVSYFLFDLLTYTNLEDYHEDTAKEYLRSICDSHYLSVSNLMFDSNIEMNLKLKKYLSDYSHHKLNELKPLIELLEIRTPKDDITLEKYKVTKECVVSDQNNKLYRILKGTIVLKKKDSYPFLSTDVNNKLESNSNYYPKKLFVSVFQTQNNSTINFNIPRNNIEYSLSETD